jgi:hypothetical protein
VIFLVDPRSKHIYALYKPNVYIMQQINNF